MRREGEHIVALNPLRHAPGRAMTFRLPLEREDLPAARAADGVQAVVRGRDYRGVPVLAYVTPIPDSDWSLVAKEDYAETIALWRFRSLLIIAGVLSLGFGLVALGVAFWFRERKAHYRDLYAAEARRRLDAEEHRVTLLAIGDAVIATDRDGRVRIMNGMAERMTGWSQAASV